MTRIGSGEPQYVVPQNNIYTGLAAAAMLASLAALGWLIVKANDVLGAQLWS